MQPELPQSLAAHLFGGGIGKKTARELLIRGNMKIRIVRTGLVDDFPPTIASYLVAEGFAIEMRPEPKLPKAQRVDLRKFREFISEHREGKKIRPA